MGEPSEIISRHQVAALAGARLAAAAVLRLLSALAAGAGWFEITQLAGVLLAQRMPDVDDAVDLMAVKRVFLAPAEQLPGTRQVGDAASRGDFTIDGLDEFLGLLLRLGDALAFSAYHAGGLAAHLLAGGLLGGASGVEQVREVGIAGRLGRGVGQLAVFGTLLVVVAAIGIARLTEGNQHRIALFVVHAANTELVDQRALVAAQHLQQWLRASLGRIGSDVALALGNVVDELAELAGRNDGDGHRVGAVLVVRLEGLHRDDARQRLAGTGYSGLGHRALEQLGALLLGSGAEFRRVDPHFLQLTVQLATNYGDRLVEQLTQLAAGAQIGLAERRHLGLVVEQAIDALGTHAHAQVLDVLGLGLEQRLLVRHDASVAPVAAFRLGHHHGAGSGVEQPGSVTEALAQRRGFEVLDQ